MTVRSKKQRRDPGSTAPTQAAAVMSRQPWTQRDWLFAFALFAAILLAYQHAWHAGYIWDDDDYVTNNRLLTAPDGLWRTWFSFDSPSQYFPLVYTTFRLEHALWGFAPAGYHWVNILLHAANALLLWRLLAHLRIPGARLAAAIFALHPVQVESVAWITELKNVQMGFFYLLSLLAWLRFTDARPHPSARFYWLSLGLYALALFSKTTACTLPAALLLIAWLRGEKIGRRQLFEIVPFIALGLGMGILTVFWERYHQGTQGKMFAVGLLDRLLVASRGVWFYLDKLAWPAKLTFSYPRWSLSASDPLAWLSPLSLCGLVWAAWWARRFIGRAGLAALAFFLITLAPVLGVIMLYTFRYTFVADHYQYLACIGPIALFSAGVERLRTQPPAWIRSAATPFSAGLLLLLAILTWLQCATYKDAETLWRATIASNPGSSMAHNNLGDCLLHEGRSQQAYAEYNESLRLDPANVEARNNLGNALLQDGQFHAAVSEFEEAIQTDPTDPQPRYNLGVGFLQNGDFPSAANQFSETIALNPHDPLAHLNLGVAFFHLNRLADSVGQFREALRLEPDLAAAHINLGLALLRQGAPSQSVAELNEALRIDPRSAEAHYHLGNALVALGRENDAIAEYRLALQCDSGDAEARYDLANALFAHGQTADAITGYRAALRVNPGLAVAHGNLAVALNTGGRTADAIVEYRQAIALDPNYVEAQFNLGNALLATGDAAGAIAHIEKAAQLQPGSPIIDNALAWVLATAGQPALRDGVRAVKLASAASQAAGGNNPIVLRTLAAAYAQAGDFQNARATAQHALDLAQAQSNPALAGVLPREIQLYTASQTFQEAR